jgi:hypothetical protein
MAEGYNREGVSRAKKSGVILRLVVIRSEGTPSSDRLSTLQQLEIATKYYAWSVMEWRRQRSDWSSEEAAKFFKWVVVPTWAGVPSLRGDLRA